MWLQRRRLQRHPEAVARLVGHRFRSPATRPPAIAAASSRSRAVNLVIVLLAGYGALHSMESPSFCGQACHEPMHPQFTAWQDDAALAGRLRAMPHRRGRAARSFTYKLNGVRQLYHVITGQIPRPIPGVRRYASGAWKSAAAATGPASDLGDVVRVMREYAEDEPNTETTTILQMFTSAGRASRRRAAARSTGTPTRACRIEYISTDEERQTIPVRPGDRTRRGRSASTSPRAQRPSSSRRARGARWTASTATTSSRTAIAPTAEQAVDAAHRAPARSPQAAVRPARGRAADEGELRDQDEGRAGHRRRAAEVLRVERAARSTPARSTGRSTTLQDIYRRNVFPGHEGHLRRVSGQPRPHHVVRVLPLPRRQPRGRRTARRSTPTASTATSRSTCLP